MRKRRIYVGYRCPVCGGRGSVQFGFYGDRISTYSTSTVNLEMCRTCKGTTVYPPALVSPPAPVEGERERCPECGDDWCPDELNAACENAFHGPRQETCGCVRRPGRWGTHLVSACPEHQAMLPATLPVQGGPGAAGRALAPLIGAFPEMPEPCSRCGEAVCECADGDPGPDGLLAAYFAGSADLRRAVAAVLHELEHGPASEGDPAAIAWCAKMLRSVTDSSRISTPAPAPQPEERARCGICGGVQVTIRAQYPHGPPRNVCPTCIADRLARIHEESSPTYGVAYAATPTPEEP